jgi:hypothetical protein
MDKTILQLQQKFTEIQDQGYIKSVIKGNTAVSTTFKYLLYKPENNLEISYFDGIEIKVRSVYDRTPISLFKAIPIGITNNEIKRLRDTYGYKDPYDHKLKTLYAEFYGNTKTKSGLWYYFKLEVDRKREQIRLNVYDIKQNLIDNQVHWDFNILKEKLYRKLQTLVMIKAWTEEKQNIEYYKYVNMSIYTLKDFKTFIDLIEKGIIKVSVKIGNYYDKKRYGMLHLYDVSFCIKEIDILKLYDIYK